MYFLFPACSILIFGGITTPSNLPSVAVSILAGLGVLLSSIKEAFFTPVVASWTAKGQPSYM